MTDVEAVVTDFAATGRTGRRNALPDILGSNAGAAGAADLPNKLSDLAVGDEAEHGGEASSSSEPASDPAAEKDEAEGT